MQRLIERVPLQRGAHPDRAAGLCAMEMVAWLAGEPHSDEPACACPVVGAFVRACNDAMDDERRNRHLRPLVPVLVNSRGSAADERARGFLVLDVLVRELVPALLRRRRQRDEAMVFEALAPIRSGDALVPAQRALEHYAPALHAARWVVQRALEGVAPARFVAGAVQVVRALHDDASWGRAARLIEAMCRHGQRQMVANG